MTRPIIAEIIAIISTPALAVSLAALANGCIFGLAKSTTYSIAVLKNSAIKTNPINTRHINHSK